jgi:ribosomal protein L10
MGKNTMVRRALRGILADFPQFEKLLPHVKGNIGFVFTSGDLKDVRSIILSNVVAAPARAGALAPVDVYVPAGNTGMEPGKTSFFQALNIPTKIARGTIEIVSDVQVVQSGTRVGTSEATLLNMLNISPFTYGMTVVQIYDNGAIFPSTILDIEESALLAEFASGVKTIAAISLAINFPTIASVAHSFVNSYKNVLAISLATDYEFEGSAKVSDCSCFVRCFFITHHWMLYTLKIPTMASARLASSRSVQALLEDYYSHSDPSIPSFSLLPIVGSAELTSCVDQGVPRQPRGFRCRRRPCRFRGRPRCRRGRPCRQGGGGGGL